MARDKCSQRRYPPLLTIGKCLAQGFDDDKFMTESKFGMQM